MSDEITQQEEQTVEEPKIESLEDLQRLAEEGLPQTKGDNPTLDQQAEIKAETENPAPEAEETPSYEPNLSYTVRDEERSFDERFKGLIKDKETEDLLRDLYTKADGLETYKEKLSKREDEYGQLLDQANALTGGFASLKQMRDKKDFRGLQQALGLDPDFVVNWGLSVVEEDELPPEQKAALEKQRQLEFDLAEKERRIRQFEQQSQDTRVQEDVRRLQTLASSPDVLPVVKALNEKGINFADLVVSQGNLEYQQTGKEPTVEDVVFRVAEKYKFLVPQQTTQKQVTEQVAGQLVAPVTEAKKPTLPSLGGINQATVDQPITSMEDLKKLADSL